MTGQAARAKQDRTAMALDRPAVYQGGGEPASPGLAPGGVGFRQKCYRAQ